MNLEFQEIKNKKQWNDFVLSNEKADILQAWEWGETKCIEGWEPSRVAIVDDELSMVYAAQVLVKEIKFLGKLAYIPHGPIFNDELGITDKELTPATKSSTTPFFKSGEKEEVWDEFQKGLVDWAKENDIFLIEMEPKCATAAVETLHCNVSVSESSNVSAPKPGNVSAAGPWKISGRNRQPKHKLFMDLTKPDEELMLGMKKNTRYNVRYAKKHGVEIKKYKFNDPEINNKIDEFHALLLKMQERAKGYPVRSKAYFERLVEEFKETDSMMIVEASFEGEIIAMNISQFTDHWSCSFYAGSDFTKHSKLKASYLLRWASIQEAKKRGCKTYSFWGIIPNSEQHKGYSEQKLSFGGDRVDYVGILTYPINTFKSFIWELMLKLVEIKSKLRYG